MQRHLVQIYFQANETEISFFLFPRLEFGLSSKTFKVFGKQVNNSYLRQILKRVDDFVDLVGASEQTLLDGLVEEERSGAGGRRGHPTLTRRRRNAASDLLDKLLAVIVANVQILSWGRIA